MATKSKKKFYITTTIPYANAPPHIGFTLEIVQADVLARWHRLIGEKVFFLTGTDEHGSKNYRMAKEQGLTPQAFVDKNSNYFRELTKILNISNNNFIRTTDKKVHWPGVLNLWKILAAKGDIYKKKYTGSYCSGCERFVTEKDLIDGKCPDHPNLKIELISEENYFFDLSKYSGKITQLVKEDKIKIRPLKWKNDFLSLIKDGLTDVSFSRDKEHLPWGIPVPGDENQVMYVWADALTNYLTGIGYPDKKYEKFWPADVHVVGKDMLRFHSGIWPGMLLSAGLPLPKEIIVHGFLIVDGQKMSKSLGNVISPLELRKKYDSDSIRYYLARTIPFGDDGDFSEKGLVQRHNDELANKLGNLISRISTLIEKYGMEKCENKLLKKLKIKEIEKHIEKYEIDKAVNEIFAFIDVCNEYVQNKKPWETHDKKVLYEIADSIKAISILLWPFIPSTSEKISEQFGFELKYDEIKKPLKISKIKKGEILFKKIEIEEEKKEEKDRILSIEVFPELSKKGINVFSAVFKNVKISNKNLYLENLKKEILNSEINLDKKIIDGYKEFYKDKNMLSGADSILSIINKNKMFPNINTIVDAYNLASIKTSVSMGAHDLEKLKGNLRIKLTDGSEHFIPLGQKELIKVELGEYACMDDEKILCRMDIKQCDETKITKNTKEFVIYAQGNKNVNRDYLKNSLINACELIKKANGGEYNLIEQKINKQPEVKEIMTGVGSVNFSDWEKLDLRVAKIKKVEDIEGADKLYKLELDVGELGKRIICAGIKQFYPKEKLKNKKIIYFSNLAPRVMRGIESQGMLLAASDNEHKKVLLISPDEGAEPGMRIG